MTNQLYKNDQNPYPHVLKWGNKMKVGYIRVSTVEQNTVRQLDGISLDKIFQDKVSAKTLDRPAFSDMMTYLREGDKLFVHSMDRLARNVIHLRTTVEELIKKNVEVTFLKENMTFNSENNPMSMLMLSIMGAFGEFEYDIMKERQREGIKFAREAGSYKGRSKSLTAEQIKELKEMTDIEGMKKSYISKKFGVSRRTLYNYLKEDKKEKKDE